MDEITRNMLKSSDDDVRIEGIRRLARAQSPDAIRIVTQIFKNDGSTRVRLFAAQVAKDIKQKQVQLAQELASRPRKLTPTEMAHQYLKKALHEFVDYEYDEAWKTARKAFETDATLADDDYALAVTSEITGSNPLIAVEVLMENEVMPVEYRMKLRKKVDQRNRDRLTWRSAIINLALYAIILACSATIPFYLFVSGTQDYLTTTIDTRAIDNALQSAVAFSILGFNIGVATFFIVFMIYLILASLLHFFARFLLNGKGYFTNLVNNLRTPLIIHALFMIGSIYLWNTFLADFVDSSPFGSNGDPQLQAQNTVRAVRILLSINVLFLMWIPRIISKTYQLRLSQSLLVILLTAFLIGGIIVATYFTLILQFIS